MLFNATFKKYFSYTVALSFIGGGNVEYLEKTTDLQQVTDKLYHIKLQSTSRHKRGSNSQL